MTWPDLLSDEIELPDPDDSELFFRGARADQFDDGEFSAGVFAPNLWSLSSDERDPGQEKLSGARQTKQTPAGLKAERDRCVAVAGVSVAEVQSCDLRAVDDSQLVADATGHTFLDFRRLVREERAKRRAVREQLAECANSRGPQT